MKKSTVTWWLVMVVLTLVGWTIGAYFAVPPTSSPGLASQATGAFIGFLIPFAVWAIR